MTEQGPPTDPDDSGVRPSRERRPVRRTPNFIRFMITGAVIGFIAGALIATTGPDASGYSSRTGIALIGVLLAAIGALLAAAVGLALERLLNRQ